MHQRCRLHGWWKSGTNWLAVVGITQLVTKHVSAWKKKKKKVFHLLCIISNGEKKWGEGKEIRKKKLDFSSVYRFPSFFFFLVATILVVEALPLLLHRCYHQVVAVTLFSVLFIQPRSSLPFLSLIPFSSIRCCVYTLRSNRLRRPSLSPPPSLPVCVSSTYSPIAEQQVRPSME